MQNGGGIFNWLKERLNVLNSNDKDSLQYMINKDINVKHKNKDDTVEFILETFQNKIATEPDKNELTSSNYIYWVINNLFLMYSVPNDSSMDEALKKFLNGPSYKNIEDTENKEVTEKDVIATQEHVKDILKKLPNKDLFALLGFSYLHRSPIPSRFLASKSNLNELFKKINTTHSTPSL